LFAELNWAATYTGWGFIIQGLLLLGLGFLGWLDREPAPQSCTVGYIGLGLGIFALVVYPFIIPLTGRSWGEVELFGTAPDPTAMATLGLLLLPRRVPWMLMVVPILWCAFSGATWLALDWYPGLIVPAATLVFLALAVRKISSR